jgi:hypothetical protein
VTFQVPVAASVKIVAFWDIAPCCLVEVDRRFRGAYCHHHQVHRPDDGGTMHLRNVGLLQHDYKPINLILLEFFKQTIFKEYKL